MSRKVAIAVIFVSLLIIVLVILNLSKKESKTVNQNVDEPSIHQEDTTVHDKTNNKLNPKELGH